MKILMFMGGGDVGGAKTHIMSLALKLSKIHQFKLISFREGDFPNEAKKLGIDVLVLKSNNLLAVASKLRKLYKEFKPDIIHTHGAKANLLAVMSKNHIPIVSTIHSDYKLDYLGSKRKQCTFGVLNAISLRKIDFYVSVANRMRDLLITRKFDPNQIFTIYNGLDFDEEPKNYDRYKYFLDKGFEISQNDIIIGIAARLTEIKDIKTLLLSFKKAYDKNNNLRLAIAGDGEDLDMLKSLSKELNIDKRVMFLGWISDINNFFSSIDINVLSSISETFPYSILEGILEGCATICSDVGGMGELIDNNENGYIFTPKDVDTLAKQIYDLSINDEKREQFSKLLYEKAKKYYSLENTLNTQLEIYNNCIEKYNFKKRQKITICGAYGKGNAGDDAILRAIVSEMRQIDKNIPIVVMSRSPLDTKLDYKCDSVFTFNVFKFVKSFRKSKLYINGGGSLIQDVTSSRSLYFYLSTLALAKISGAKVMMYGCGIGPVKSKFNKLLSTYIMNKYVDVITLRDEISRDELTKMSVTKPKIIVSADPTLNLTPANENLTLKVFDKACIPKGEKYLGLGIRNWSNLDKVKLEIAKSIDYAYEKYGLIPVFLPIEYPSDLKPASEISNLLKTKSYIVKTRQKTETTIALFAKMDLVLGIRLHSLIFSAGNNVPVIGMSYDIKVDGFLKYIDPNCCVSLEDITYEKLCKLIDVSQTQEYKEKVINTAKMLKNNEIINVNEAKKLII